VSTPEPSSAPPVTGVAGIDEALAGLELGDDLAGHHPQLTAALDVLQRALNDPPADDL